MQQHLFIPKMQDLFIWVLICLRWLGAVHSQGTPKTWAKLKQQSSTCSLVYGMMRAQHSDLSLLDNSLCNHESTTAMHFYLLCEPAPMTAPVGHSVHRRGCVFHLPLYPMLIDLLL
jgi:hypothetical protein